MRTLIEVSGEVAGGTAKLGPDCPSAAAVTWISVCGVVLWESAELVEELSSFAGDTAGSWRAAAVGGEREWQLHSHDGGSLPVEACTADPDPVGVLSAVTSLTDSEVAAFE